MKSRFKTGRECFPKDWDLDAIEAYMRKMRKLRAKSPVPAHYNKPLCRPRKERGPRKDAPFLTEGLK